MRFRQVDEEAERQLGAPFDLALCAAEPIHRLGSVQSHGALLAARSDVIEVASANLADVVGVATDEVLRGPLRQVLDESVLDRLAAVLNPTEGSVTITDVAVGRSVDRRIVDLTAHRSEGLTVVEMQPPVSDPAARSLRVSTIGRVLRRLQGCGTVLDACQAVVAEMRALTGYDRVVVYRFADPDGPGEVIAEQVADGWEPWLGLWFPATDIPPQARRLYETNWIRVIADTTDDGAPLITAAGSPAGPPLDLSQSVLRSVSPFHLEYLRNLGVRSSMSVSLLVDERLWGLIACHGRDVRVLSPAQREACELLGATLSLHLATLRRRDERAALDDARAALARILPVLDAAEGFPPVDVSSLQQLIESDTVVVSVASARVVAGPDPGEAVTEEIRRSMADPGGDRAVTHTDHLGGVDAGLARHAALASGALVLPLSRAKDSIIWLRRQRLVDRRWAVDPDHPVQTGPNGVRLTPRGSTAVFNHTIRGHSQPWAPADIVAATELGRLLTDVVLRHSAEIADVNTTLAHANRDLEFFIHAIAHDLREPLRGISHNAVFIAEDAITPHDPTTSRRLVTIEQLATRTSELLDNLLRYARTGHQGMHRRPTDLRELTERAAMMMARPLQERGVQLRLPEPGLTVDVDPGAFEEVLGNLLSNAAKYAAADEPRWVRVSLSEVIPPGHTHPVPTIDVTDNGVGIPEDQRSRVFDMFTRLETATDSGHGFGLAIVRRIVEHHDGQVWIADGPSGVTTFRIALPPAAGTSDRSAQ